AFSSLSLHDALPISFFRLFSRPGRTRPNLIVVWPPSTEFGADASGISAPRPNRPRDPRRATEECSAEQQGARGRRRAGALQLPRDRKSTRLNSSHVK